MKINLEMDYLIAGPNKEIDMAASTKMTKEMQDMFSFMVLHGHIFITYKEVQIYMKPHPGVWHTLQKPFQKKLGYL